MTDGCQNCQHLHMSGTGSQITASCGEMNSRIACGFCGKASSIEAWMQTARSRWIPGSGRFDPICPSCGSTQRLPKETDGLTGYLGPVDECMTAPVWCEWFEAVPEPPKPERTLF